MVKRELPPDALSYQLAELAWATENILKGLEALARDARMEAGSARYSAEAGLSDYGTYVGIAAAVVHKIQWGIANLSLGHLIREAAIADVLAAEAKAAEHAG